MITAASLIAATVIFYHALVASSRASWRTWRGPRWRFVALAVGFAAAAVGGLGVALGVPHADTALLIGASIYLAGNRRHCIPRREDLIS